MTIKKIIVLTYQCPHRKTFDTLCRLKAMLFDDVLVYATPLTYKKKYVPIVSHRPENTDIHTKTLCAQFGYKYQEIKNYDEIDCSAFCVLVCGAGILPYSFWKNNHVINAHPGYIPDCRGLDALKWAVIEDKPIGVTTHLIGNEVDAGQIIERRLVPLLETDTFHTVAQRQYEMEISMLVNAINKISDPHIFIAGGENPIHRRMPHDIEKKVYTKFLEKTRQQKG